MLVAQGKYVHGLMGNSTLLGLQDISPTGLLRQTFPRQDVSRHEHTS